MINMTVRFGSLAFRICQPRRATLEATALTSELVPGLGENGDVRAYSIPTANTREIPSFLFNGMCKFQTATSGMISMTRSDKTLMMDAVTRRE